MEQTQSKVYGYCRISTQKQSIERQIRNIKAVYPDAVVVEEAYTGTQIDRPKFDKLLKGLKMGDTIVFDSVSRMSRNADEGFKLYMELYQKGINLVFLKEQHINTAVYAEALKRQINASVETGDEATNKLIQSISEAVNAYMMALAEKQIQIAFEQSEKEVDDLHKRTSEGMMTAKLNGKQIGAVSGTHWETQKAKQAKAVILQHSADFNGTLNDADCMKLCGVARNTFYSYKKALKEEGDK